MQTYSLALSRSLTVAENDILFEWLAHQGNAVKFFDTFWVYQSPFSAEQLLAHFAELLPPDVQAFVCALGALPEFLRLHRSGLEWLWPDR